MLLRIARALWGDLTKEELKRFVILGVTMMLVIGIYWMLRVTKDGLFVELVGFRKWQPVAKMASVVVMVFAVLLYSKLLDLFKRTKLIYIFAWFYGISFIILGFLITNLSLIAVDPSSILYPLVSWIPAQMPGGEIGWVDLFGNRLTKASGATVTKTFGYALPALRLFGTLISFSFLIVWLFVGRYVGNRFDKLEKTNTIVE